MMTSFAEMWQDRYLRGTATYDHIERLKSIGRLTDEEFRMIVVSKKLQGRRVRGDVRNRTN